MRPKYYIEDVIKLNEMLFVGTELFINTKKRQDSKYIFASYNVSQSIETSNENSDQKSGSLGFVGQLLNTYLDSNLPLERFTQESKDNKDLMPIGWMQPA